MDAVRKADEDSAPRVTVIVCGHNGAGTLPGLLSALQKQTLPRSEFEVVYVDDASTDDSVAVVERAGVARVVAASEQVGLPRARNLGIRESRAEVLAFTDVDTLPDDRWLEAGRRRFEDPRIDYLAGGITIPVGKQPTIAALVDATTFLDQEVYVREGYAAGANFWVRRPLAEGVGGFNEDLEHYGGDDEEFGWRLTAAGAPPRYAPEVRLSHPPRVRLRDLARKAYRLGYSHAIRRRVPTGALSGTSPMYLRPRAYLPARRLHRLGRVAELDYVPTVVELVQMHLARYVWFQLPMLAGDYVGERRQRRRSGPLVKPS